MCRTYIHTKLVRCAEVYGASAGTLLRPASGAACAAPGKLRLYEKESSPSARSSLIARGAAAGEVHVEAVESKLPLRALGPTLEPGRMSVGRSISTVASAVAPCITPGAVVCSEILRVRKEGSQRGEGGKEGAGRSVEEARGTLRGEVSAPNDAGAAALRIRRTASAIAQRS